MLHIGDKYYGSKAFAIAYLKKQGWTESARRATSAWTVGFYGDHHFVGSPKVAKTQNGFVAIASPIPNSLRSTKPSPTPSVSIQSQA